MFRFKNFIRIGLFSAFSYAAWWGLYLQEWTLNGNQLELAALEKGLSIPLDDPKVVISFERKTLTVFSGSTAVKRYDIAVGRARQPGVMRRTAQSTPLGDFKVIIKKERDDPLTDGSRFLGIDFPRIDDVEIAYDQGLINYDLYLRCVALYDLGSPMPQDTLLGGGLGVQGNYFIFEDDHSTNGSIGMRNSDINELYPHIPIGTPVIIEP